MDAGQKVIKPFLLWIAVLHKISTPATDIKLFRFFGPLNVFFQVCQKIQVFMKRS